MATVFFVALAVSAGAIQFMLASKLAWRIATDIPNARSLHDKPIPRVGGWGVIPAAVAAAFFAGAGDWLLAGLAAVLFVVSYADDRMGLPIVVRLPAHLIAAAVWLAFGPIDLSPGVAALAAFAIVWVLNLFNFMDGADGLAGGMALFAFSAYALVASAFGETSLAVWSLAIAGAAAGFLLFNFNPAKVFLGDAGSVTVGFLAGTFGIWGWAAGAWPFWFPFLVSAPFFLDATVTILKRIARREPFWRAHREHYYQRLIRSGWSHRRTALAEYVLMALSGGLAVVMLDWSTQAQWLGLGAAVLVYVAIGYAVDRRWSAFDAPRGDVPAAAAHRHAAPRMASRFHGSPPDSSAVQQEGFLGERVRGFRRQVRTLRENSAAAKNERSVEP